MNYYYPYFSYMNNYVYHPFYPIHLSNDDPYTFQSYINTYNSNIKEYHHQQQQHSTDISNVTHNYGNYINKAQLNKIINKPVSLDLIQFNPKNKFSFELIKLKPPLNTNNNNTNTNTSNTINNSQSHLNQPNSSDNNEQISILDLQKKYGNANSSTFTFETIIHKDNNNDNDNTAKEQKPPKLSRRLSISAKDSQSNTKQFELFKEYLKSTYHLEDIDIKNLNGKELTEYLHQHKDIDKINFNQLQTFIPEDILKSLRHKYKHILILYDRDKSGMRNARSLSKRYKLDAFFVHKRFKAKDLSDAVRDNGFDEVKKWLIKTLERYD